jgi:hypothetical protein
MTGGYPRPVYARVLRLRRLRPGGLLCFLFFEGSIGLAILLALAELVSWWGVFVLPVTIALMVKLNDVVAVALARNRPDPEPTRARTPIRPTTPASRPTTPAIRPARELSWSHVDPCPDRPDGEEHPGPAEHRRTPNQGRFD